MRISIRSTARGAGVGGLGGGVSAVARAQQGTVAGRVTDQPTVNRLPARGSCSSARR